MQLKNILIDSKVYNGFPATSLVLFPESKEEKNFCKSDDFYGYENKTCSDETHTLTCGLVMRVFTCRMHHTTNPMKKGFRFVSKINF